MGKCTQHFSLKQTIVSSVRWSSLKITSNFRLRVNHNLHTESHQNSWISTSKNDIRYNGLQGRQQKNGHNSTL